MDASVVVKWFLEEPSSKEARRLRNDHLSDVVSVEAPAILPFEVLNAARYSGCLDRGELGRIAVALDQAAIPLHAMSGDLSAKSLEVAELKDLTVYDASYIALAQLLDAPLYTADAEMLDAARDVAKAYHVRDYHGRAEG